jgi:HEAT repeat protein
MDKNNTTVIRWCAAYALGEIARNNPDTWEELLPVFENLSSQEENSGVRKVYQKTLKELKNQKM